MIFLYGGAFVSGATALPEYDGTQLVADQGIIVATINYRLNIFGFPNSPAITVKNPGLLDQRLGVEWLRDNIKTFGGDPSRMTLSGQSAGSQSVAIWSYAYPDDPIVSGLIEFSGQASLIPPDDGSSWKSVANTTGCSNPDANAELECMRSVPPRQLKRAIGINNTPTLADPGTITGGVPAVDNVTIFAAADYKARGETGRFTKVPLLLSNTLNEADLFLPYSPADGVNTTLSDEITLVSYHCPVAATASYWAAQKIPTWRYVFSGYFEETIPYSWMRPFHGADTELVFGLLHSAAYQDPGPEVQKAGNYIQDAVAAFVRDPVHGLENFGWKTYNPNTTTLINLFGNNSAEVTFTDPSVYDLPCQSL
ncbi:hypothetical protein MMC10_008276 [Thelotrema lepadinum]|nr:hypothetical protein [Thelotrema lepadinum]